HVSAGNPACMPANHFNDATRTIFRGHAAHIRRNFHHGGGGVFDDRTIAWSVIGVGKVVIDGFGHADDAHFIAAADRFLVEYVGGILGIVAADVEEVADIVGLKHPQQPG